MARIEPVKQRIVLLGPPASGKGTQAELIRAEFGIETPSIGAILREQKAAGTPLGRAAARFTEEGRLVPDEIILDLARTWLDAHDDAFVFDGFPRTVGQAEALEHLLNERGTPLEMAISLEADAETIRERVRRRLACGTCGVIVSAGLHVESAASPCTRCGGALARRADDTPETLEQRLVEYREKSEPLIAFYAGRGILASIAADGGPERVFAEVAAVLRS